MRIMKEKVNSKIMWNDAGKAGIVLGGVVILYSLLVSLAAKPGGMISSILSFLLWGLKFGNCIFLMRFFMVRLSQKYDGVTSRTAFGHGVRIALLSALVCSAYMLSDVLLHPESVEQVFELVQTQFAGMMDSNGMAVIDRMQQNYPAYMFFSNFIYCFLFGVVLAKIFSSKFPQPDPFAEPGDQN